MTTRFPIPDQSDGDWWAHFRALLDDQNDWPADYLFKFILPRSAQVEVEETLAGYDLTIRASSRGKYVSVTTSIRAASSEDVVAVYSKIGMIDGVIML